MGDCMSTDAPDTRGRQANYQEMRDGQQSQGQVAAKASKKGKKNRKASKQQNNGQFSNIQSEYGQEVRHDRRGQGLQQRPGQGLQQGQGIGPSSGIPQGQGSQHAALAASKEPATEIRIEQAIAPYRKEIERLKQEQQLSQEKFRAVTEEGRKLLHEKDREILRLKGELYEKEKQCKELLERLSRIAATNLTDKNPNIADLSDENRPTKLAEKFTELYDNSWTEAFTELECSPHNFQDRDSIRLLLAILMQCFQYCQTKATEELRQIESSISRKFSEYERKEQMKQLKDRRRKHFKEDVQAVQKELKAVVCTLSEFPKKEPRAMLSRYIEDSAELCWLMSVQDPPLFLRAQFADGAEFNSDLLRAYTSSGKYVAYVVWPVMLLHRDGPLLIKGVAQGCKDPVIEKQKHAPLANTDHSEIKPTGRQIAQGQSQIKGDHSEIVKSQGGAVHAQVTTTTATKPASTTQPVHTNQITVGKAAAAGSAGQQPVGVTVATGQTGQTTHATTVYSKSPGSGTGGNRDPSRSLPPGTNPVFHTEGTPM